CRTVPERVEPNLAQHCHGPCPRLALTAHRPRRAQRRAPELGPLSGVISHQNVLQHRHGFIPLEVLECPGYTLTLHGMGWEARQLDPVQPDGTPGGRIKTANNIHQGTLARPIWADQAANLPWRHGHTDVI